MDEYGAIRDAIEGLGASLLEEHLPPESFGSAYAVFEGPARERFRFVWDGKEGYGFLQAPAPADSWRGLEPRVFGASAMQSCRLAELLSLARKLINGNFAV